MKKKKDPQNQSTYERDLSVYVQFATGALSGLD